MSGYTLVKVGPDHHDAPYIFMMSAPSATPTDRCHLRAVIWLAVVTIAATMLCIVLASPAAPAANAVCHASAIHYRNDRTSPDGIHGVPWIASTNQAFHGYLFYLGGTRWGHTQPRTAKIFTIGSRVRVNPKVLWVAQRPTRTTIAITGTRLDATGSFAARYPAASGGRTQFPSYVKVPAEGCWRISLRSGALRGSVTFAAVNLP